MVEMYFDIFIYLFQILTFQILKGVHRDKFGSDTDNIRGKSSWPSIELTTIEFLAKTELRNFALEKAAHDGCHESLEC